MAPIDIAQPGVKLTGQELLNARRDVANLLGRKSLAFPGAQPVSFARRHLDDLRNQESVNSLPEGSSLY
jgi:mRNA guanylyltransferase